MMFISQSYLDIPIPARGEIVLRKVLDYETLRELTVGVVAKVSSLKCLEYILFVSRCKYVA